MAEQHAFEFLKNSELQIPPVCALVGEDQFLVRRVLSQIRQSLNEEASVTEFGADIPWRDVHDELSTLSLFGDGPRVVVVQSGDEFVKANRASLEALVAKPVAGCLVFGVKTMPTSTKLYKALVEFGMVISCNPPKKGKSLDQAKVCQWIREWATASHGIAIKRGADEELLGLVGTELGMIDQELAKLALFCASGEEVTIELVQKIVGGWRTKTSWDLFDAILSGQGADALLQLDRLLQAGEPIQMIVGGMVWSFRRFANAAHVVIEAEQAGKKVSLGMAIEQSGIKNWQGAAKKAEQQLRQLGRERAADLYRRLLELDLSLKGSHASPVRSRWAVERFILGLSREAKAG